MVEVEIQGIVVTHQYGTLNTGDVLRTDPEFAKHLVEDCGAAKYRSPASASAQTAAPTEAAEVATPGTLSASAAPTPPKPGRSPKVKQ